MTPHRKIPVGVVMILVLPFTYATNAIATNAYPKQWGGPNFLAGAFDLVAIAIAGVLLLVRAHRQRGGR